MSRASRASIAKSQKAIGLQRKPSAKPADQESVITASEKKNEETESDIEEEDEWTAIQKFNAILHYEEQKQAAAREAERKRLLRIELEAQKKEKLQKIERQKQEDQQYFLALQDHLKVLDHKEEAKQKLAKDKIMHEKQMRDQQLKKTEHQRRKEQRENMATEQ